MAAYHYVVSDTTAGTNLAELPLTLTGPFTRILNGIGQLSATLPVTHPTATTTNLQANGDREITVYRDDNPIWNGPITSISPQRRSEQVQITAREAHWYMTKRVLEVDYINTGDIFNLMRDLYNNAVGKESNGATSGGSSINASLPRFVISPSSGAVLAGASKTVSYSGAQRLVFWDIFTNDFINDPSNGIDIRMDYTTGSNRQQCQRHFAMAYQNIGTTRTQILTEVVLDDYGYTDDADRAATRIHVLGSGYDYTAQNTGSISAGLPLLDAVYSRSDSPSQAVIQTYANEARRLAQPPVRAYQASFVPGDAATGALPFGWCDLGDKVTLAISQPAILALSDTRRVIQIDVTPPTGAGPEMVTLTFNLPLDRLGT